MIEENAVQIKKNSSKYHIFFLNHDKLTTISLKRVPNFIKARVAWAFRKMSEIKFRIRGKNW